MIKYIVLKFLFKNISYFLSIGKLNKNLLYHNVDHNKIFSAPYFVDNNFLKITKKNLKKKLKIKIKNYTFCWQIN